MPNPPQLWTRYREQLITCADIGLRLDLSRMDLPDDHLARLAEPMQRAHHAMQRVEAGDIANPDEDRMVGHYWLRAPHLAPSTDLRQAIEQGIDQVRTFARDVHEQRITPATPAITPASPAARFTDLLLIGIGGSALGPQLVSDALATRRDRLRVHFMDNTDPDGIQRILASLTNRLKSTLVLVVSKSGTTPETRNGMLETRAAFASKKLDFPRHAVAITGEGSKLDNQARDESWLARLPMWDWVGGRTSVTSAVGLLPAALQGLDVDGLLQGAAAMDAHTRETDTAQNPAAMLAAGWHHATGGRGAKDMVILPYKDRLLLLSRYLQQLVMESLGKGRDLEGHPVEQGIAVYGNKGSTDQHAFVQQLREGLNNFFVTFIVVNQDDAGPRRRSGSALEVDDNVTAGDYLHGFWLGTRQALYDNGRTSITITLDRLDARSLGALIALYERAVGYYAALVNINAYHQPGVEAGKKAAAAVLDLQQRAIAHLKASTTAMTTEELAAAINAPDAAETLHHILEHLAANARHVRRRGERWAAR
ncbi:MAG: glucose-6-phosphate isomerase [Phycisphaeraceae bacterium]